MKRFALAAAFLAAMSWGASADEAQPWTGFYGGLGITAGTSIHDTTVDADSTRFLGIDGFGGDGIGGRAQLGYDKQVGRVVIGAFVDYDLSDMSFDADILRNSGSVEMDHMWTVGARAGLLLTPATLVYGFIGYTEGEFDAPKGLDLSDVTGYSTGVGVEHQISGSWFLKGEYRFTQFDEETLFANDCVTVKDEPRVHTGMLSVVYKFNGTGNGINSLPLALEPDHQPLK